ncbi:MAG: copper chaperone PCu(A)C [Anaerolineae bacterium]|nr:copper chaperone PCu(A)C [Anaerolineae bacterium]MDW8171762.1 copper chaperone PCu(A)C [Anaerolineae bacterium]
MKFFRLMSLAALSIGLMSATQAHEHHEIVVMNAWARATVSAEAGTQGGKMSGHSHGSGHGHGDVGKVSAAYMTIRNDGDHSMTLISASTPLAGKVEIHESKMEGDVMRMAQLAEGLTITEGETVELKPGGFHIMLMDLQVDLVEGTAIPLELVFSMGEGLEPMSVMIGAAVLIDAPEASPLEITQGWVRPTALKEQAQSSHGHGGHGHSHGGHSHGSGMGHGHGSGDMSSVTAAYMTITNTGDKPVRIVSASAEAAKVGLTEIHETIMQGDVMRMNELAEGLLIDPGQTVELKPGGLHIMLMELQAPLMEGEAIALTLSLDDGSIVVLGLPIYDKMALEHNH